MFPSSLLIYSFEDIKGNNFFYTYNTFNAVLKKNGIIPALSPVPLLPTLRFFNTVRMRLPEKRCTADLQSKAPATAR